MSGIVSTAGNIPHLGELLALASAVVWAVAVILFRISGEDHFPVRPQPLQERRRPDPLRAAPSPARQAVPAGRAGGGLRPAPRQRLPGHRRLRHAVPHGPQPARGQPSRHRRLRLQPVHHRPLLHLPRRAPESLAVPGRPAHRGGDRRHGLEERPGERKAPPPGPLPGHRPGRPGHADRRRRHRHDQADARPHRCLLGHGHEDRRRDRRPDPLPRPSTRSAARSSHPSSTSRNGRSSFRPRSSARSCRSSSGSAG